MLLILLPMAPEAASTPPFPPPVSCLSKLIKGGFLGNPTAKVKGSPAAAVSPLFNFDIRILILVLLQKPRKPVHEMSTFMNFTTFGYETFEKELVFECEHAPIVG